MTDLEWLTKWLKKSCESDLRNDIEIHTMDNPGWYLWINLEKSKLQNIPFEIVDIERAEDNWLYCSIEEGVFKGFGGPFNLPEIMQIFRIWAEKNQ